MAEGTAMEFEQVAARRAEAPDGAVVELVDHHHARLDGPSGSWLVEIGLGTDEDWFAIAVYGDTLVRAGGDPDGRAREQALARIVAGIRELRVRVGVEEAVGEPEVLRPVPPADDAPA